ncbi:glycosyltransferase family 39 protein [Pelagicoccus albus]|uniref:Glycosyltransferase family 39 protein n=1 Tax=Pelagicoccus albus TaxID=415222 RepID=A0A7X1E860_9BACT|nr:glycosyltransferase family 39 protein [Pelagicoccus albus]MBC2606470.1 glycosyltransferase family 39 protein [Pelagicoccus albus]
MSLESAPTAKLGEKLILPAFLAAGCIAFYLAFIGPDVVQAETAFIDFGYLNMCLLFGTFVWCCIPLLQEKQGFWKNRDFLVLASCALLGAFFLYTREGGGFKVSFDEEVLSNVAQNLANEHIPVMRESSLQGLASFEMIDKRPLLFPFLVSILHSVFGFRIENAFYLNFALTFVYLYLLASITKKVHSTSASYFTLFLACMMPILGQNASSGGFDILNMTIALGVAWFAIDYKQNPNAATMARLLFGTALVAHIRYESSILGVPVIILIASEWIRSKRITLSPSILLIPFTYMPVIWQLRAISANPENFQYKTDGAGTFSIAYVAENLQRAYKFFFIPSDSYAGSPFVAFIGFAGLLALIGKLASSKTPLIRTSDTRKAILIMSLYPLLHFAMIMSFYYGQFDDPIVTRLSIPIVTLLVACGGGLLASLFRRNGKLRVAVSIALVCCGVYGTRVYSSHEYSSTSEIAKRSEWALEFADSLPVGNYLFVTTMPRIFELHGLNNLSTVKARGVLKKIKNHLDLKTYNAVFILQNLKLERKDGELIETALPYNDLGPAVTLETIKEISFTPHNFCRISRIAAIDISADVPAAKQVTTAEETAQIRRVSPEEIRKWQKSLP